MIKISVHILFYPIVRNLFLPFEKFFFIIRISSPRAKLNFSKSDFRQNFESHQEYFLPVWKFVITVSWSAAKEYSSRGEKSNTGGREKILICQHSPRILSMRQHAEMCSLPGLTIIVYFTSSTAIPLSPRCIVHPAGTIFSPRLTPLPLEESLRPVRSMEHRFTAYKGR